jgi:DNA-binding LytR/AlgR family response regulator
VIPDGISGLELARTLRQHRPELPVLLAIGYSQYATQVVKKSWSNYIDRRDMLAASLRAAVERQPRRGRSRAGRPALLIPIARGREQTSRSTRELSIFRRRSQEALRLKAARGELYTTVAI